MFPNWNFWYENIPSGNPAPTKKATLHHFFNYPQINFVRSFVDMGFCICKKYYKPNQSLNVYQIPKTKI
jgi:hypothetical protein